ncbi:MAG: hypothetical protein V3V30_02230 [Parvularculaceae bacterium]
MKFSALFAAIAVLFGTANAANIVVQNEDFEDAFTLDIIHNLGDLSLSPPPGWSMTQGTIAGTWELVPELSFLSTPSDVDTRVAFIAGGTLYQDLGHTIQSGMHYNLSALFGNRTAIQGGGMQFEFGGTFGFFAGSINNIIASTVINIPPDGHFSAQTFTLLASVAENFAGQSLGIFFTQSDGQLIFDNVLVTSSVETPLPAAAWLFGPVIAGYAARRKLAKKKA